MFPLVFRTSFLKCGLHKVEILVFATYAVSVCLSLHFCYIQFYVLTSLYFSYYCAASRLAACIHHRLIAISH